MTDKRILKTKKCLKESLMNLVRQKPFEKITVKEICENANTGRVTFYTYYKDKYDLLSDCFRDIHNETLQLYHKKQVENNPDEDLVLCFQNLLNASLEVVNYREPTRILVRNREILSMYYDHVVKNLEEIESSIGDKYRPSYTKSRLNAFLAMGFWGFIHADPDGNLKDAQEEAQKLVRDLCESHLFEKI